MCIGPFLCRLDLHERCLHENNIFGTILLALMSIDIGKKCEYAQDFTVCKYV